LAVFQLIIEKFATFDTAHAERETLFFFKEKQGLVEIIHCISGVKGIILKFKMKQITQPLFASQVANAGILIERNALN